MKTRMGAAATMLAFSLVVPAQATGWNMAFNQGVAEYSAGSFAPGGSSVSLSCAEGGIAPGSVEVRVRRANFNPKMREPVIFTVGKRQLTMFTDADGAVGYSSVAAAPRFRTLWQMLRTGRMVKIGFGPGAPLSFSLAGAARQLGPVPCLKQLAS